MSADKLTHRYGYITRITCFQRSSKYNLCMCTILVAFFSQNILCIIFHWNCVVAADSMTILQSITNIFFILFSFFFSQWLCISYHLHIVIVSFITVHVFLFVVVIKLQIFEEFMKKGANCKSIYNSNLSKNMIGLHHQKGKKKYIITHIEKWYMPAVRCVFKKKIKPTKHKH